MALVNIQVPDIGDFDEVGVIEVLVKPGDTVKAEQSLITVESDKASMEIPSSHAGVVKDLRVQVGDKVNLERSMMMNGRLDGHIVQGHVDQVGTCTSVVETDGSWRYRFEYTFDEVMSKQGYLTVEKGSVTVNGVSLTVCNAGTNSFEVSIIPYTYEHTNFHQIKVGTLVNLEFDIIGKYISRLITR